MPKEIWTIGHSSRSFAVFLELLQVHKIFCIVDVRSYPGSRKFPHFNKENLDINLNENYIEYVHIPELGGRRKALKNSTNTALRLASFRGYADYMQTDEFENAMDILQKLALEKRIAYMCAEAVWWSCHRSLISDYLKVRDWKVFNILGKSNVQEHPYTSAAKIENKKLFYN